MGSVNKLLLPIDGQALVRRVVAACAAVTEHPVTVVTGHQDVAVEEALRDAQVIFVHNSRFEDGQMTSVDAGLRGAPIAQTYLLALGDQPLITSDDLNELLNAHHEKADGRITIPMVDGVRGNPIVVPEIQRARMLADPINLGCRKMTRNSPQHVHAFETGNRSFIVDIDTPADLILYDLVDSHIGALPASRIKRTAQKIRKKFFPPMTKDQVELLATIKFPCC